MERKWRLVAVAASVVTQDLGSTRSQGEKVVAELTHGMSSPGSKPRVTESFWARRAVGSNELAMFAKRAVHLVGKPTDQTASGSGIGIL